MPDRNRTTSPTDIPSDADLSPDRLQRQLAFILEVDKLKQVQRRTWLLDSSRYENDAEHSWHLALMVMLLHEYAAVDDLDVLRVVQMVIIHDLVEIDAGDTYAYDIEANHDKEQRERAAADRIFSLLPPDQGRVMRALWDEFEARQTPEARFAAAVDRLQPVLHNYHTDGKAWREHRVRLEQVVERNEPMGEGAPQLWEYTRALLRDAVEQGMLEDADSP